MIRLLHHFKRLSVFILLLLSVIQYSRGSVYAEIYTDDAGRKIDILKKPERIVSLAPSITEILFFLQSGNKVVGVTDYCDYPEEAKYKPRVGWLTSPSIEKIVSMQPDLVFATAEGNRPEIVEELERMKINVYVLNPHNISDVLREITAIGNITGHDNVAKNKISSLTRKIDTIKNKASEKRQKRVMYLISIDPLISAGPGSFIHDIITTAGGINVLSDSPVRYPRINMEEIILKDPEIIIAPAELVGSIQGWEKRWSSISAIKHGNVYSIDPDIISRPGPRISDSIELIYEYLHEDSAMKNKKSNIKYQK